VGGASHLWGGLWRVPLGIVATPAPRAVAALPRGSPR
jgi:hypothetical protein